MRCCLVLAITHGIFLTCVPLDAWAGQCSADQNATLTAAQADVRAISQKALASVPSAPTGVDARYTRAFGAYSDTRAARVKQTLSQVVSVTAVGNIQYDCQSNTQDRCAMDSSTWAWVTANDEYNIHVCERFFAGATKLQGPLILHELTHFNSVGDTEDPCKTVPDCDALAKSDPDTAVLSAMSYQIFAYLHRDAMKDIVDLIMTGKY